MPKSWSKKDERMYEHIKDSEKGSGRAKEIAARTVNKKRKQQGRTKGKKSTSASHSRKSSSGRSRSRSS